ncbi:PLP-dependent transferase [Saccharomonospora xinjiangensis]|uniref:trans-sulfuration enzyme family protein n=1 Tax=Saccharomonospora xinjiangensis TaxID=75294 RepID=UPI00106F8B3E|nr:PLP-dependent transferase [Saccharomonospora xinjiangensis]QBQ58444.1 Cystathionine beta-lyase [Saccharomonospora xinjiangensis]
MACVNEEWSARTKAVVAGRPVGDGEPMNVPITPASMLGLSYAREDGTPTWVAFEEAVGELEGGTAVAFASGIATVSAVLDARPSQAVVVVPSDSYAGTRGHFAHEHAKGRVRVVSVEPSDTAAWIEAAEGADLLWLESPTNPSLHVVEIAEITSAARRLKHRPTIVVDNTFATPLGQRPLSLGADIVVHSATKFIGGHSDLLLGVAVAADPAHVADLRDARTRIGATPGALETFLALRGLRTLPVRFAEAARTAALLAERLAEHPAVTRVRYPGSGAMLAVEVADADRADAVCAALRLVRHATSLGGVESTVERRAARSGDAHVPSGLLRFSIGLEDPDDLWADLNRALCSVN